MHLRYLFFIAGLWFLQIPAYTFAQSTDVMIAQATAMLDKHDFEHASKLLYRILDKHSKNAAAHAQYARMVYLGKDYDWVDVYYYNDHSEAYHSKTKNIIFRTAGY